MNVQNRRLPLPIELVTLAYTLFTTLLIALLGHDMADPWRLIEGRAFVVVGMALIYLIYRARPNRYTLFLRYLFPLSLLGYWYPDTYEFCQLFGNADHIFAQADQVLFGCQPAISFAESFPEKYGANCSTWATLPTIRSLRSQCWPRYSPTEASSRVRPSLC